MAGEPTLTLAGNITANPEQRGDTVTFTIAHNTRRRDRNGQTVDGDAVFMRCAAFGDLAQNIMRSCYKGMRVVATGYMKTNNWTDKTTGQQRSNLEMIVTDLGVSLRFGVTQFQKTSGQQSNGNGYRQNNRRRIPAAEQRLSARRIQNNYQQQGYSQQAPAQTPAQPAAPSQPAMDPWATTTPASTDPNGDGTDPEF
jgi:single-strand DNA-binding protein